MKSFTRRACSLETGADFPLGGWSVSAGYPAWERGGLASVMVLRKRKKAPRLAASSSVFTTCVCINRERQHLPPLCMPEKPSTASHIRTVSIMTYTCTELVNLLQWYDLPTMFSLEFCLGFLGNLLVILGYIFCLKEWKSTKMYLFSILFMVWVSVDRCLLLQNLKRQHFLPRRGSAIAVSAFTWLVINVQIAPPLVILIFQDMKRGNRSRCGDFGSLSADQAHDRLTYSLVVTVTGYIPPLLALCVSSGQIAYILRGPLYVVAATASMFPVLYSPCHAMRNIYISLHVSSNEGTPT
ncbi:hypothetical protein JZ751_018652, partial [Albula glossodonta]